MIVAAVPTVRETYQEDTFYPIPPPKDCIDSVDMLLNIPVAVNFFFEFIVQLDHQETVNCFALYIDLTMFDKNCGYEDEDPTSLKEKAQTIYEQYLQDEADM